MSFKQALDMETASLKPREQALGGQNCPPLAWSWGRDGEDNCEDKLNEVGVENFDVGSPTRGLCKVLSTEPHMRSLGQSSEGGHQGWGDKSTPGPLHSGAAYFTVHQWTCSEASR